MKRLTKQMKLKRYISRLSLLALPFALFACDELDESERLVYIGPAAVNRAVLIEDFTGQRCVNCPEAAIVIESLQETYGTANIVAVGIHSGPMAEGTQLRTDAGDYLYEKYEVEAQPSGLINRRGGVLQGTDEWRAQVRSEISAETLLSMSLTNEYNTADSTVTITVDLINADSINALSGQLNVWLTEDGIVNLQLMEDGSKNYDYVHNHVFRAAVTPIDGEVVGVASRQSKSVELKTKINKAWKPENMTVVAFMDSHNGVLQATKKKVTDNE